MSDEHIARQAASSFDRLENFNFLLSRHDPNIAKSRHYSFDADTAGLASFQNLNMDYDQTEGMGGLSVSSYDSIEDERSPIDVRGYPYGKCFSSCSMSYPTRDDSRCCIACAIAGLPGSCLNCGSSANGHLHLPRGPGVSGESFHLRPVCMVLGWVGWRSDCDCL